MKDNITKKNIIPTSIKFDEEVYEKIKEDADKSERSFSRQLHYIVKKYYQLTVLQGVCDALKYSKKPDKPQ